MNCRNVLSSLAVLATVFSYSADTTADIGTIEDGSHVVTAVDHTKLVNGTTSVTANQDGTASISVSSSIQKENCLRVTRTDGSTGKTIVISFQNTSAELSEWYTTWPSQLSFTVEYDGVTYDAVTVGESDSEDCREISSSLSWLNGSSLWPNGSTDSTYWDGVIINISTPGGLDIIGDGNGETCSTYTYTSSTSSSKTIATTDQIPSLSGYVSESSLVSAGYKAGSNEWVCDPSTFNGKDIQIEWSSGMGQWAMYAGSGRSQQDIIGIHTGSQSDTNLVWAARTQWAGTNTLTSVKGGLRPYRVDFVNTINGVDAENIGIDVTMPSVVCTGYSYSNGVPANARMQIGTVTVARDFTRFDVYDDDETQPSSATPIDPTVVPLYIPSNVSSFQNDANYVSMSSITNVVKDIIRQAINTGITVDGTNYVLVVEKAQ